MNGRSNWTKVQLKHRIATYNQSTTTNVTKLLLDVSQARPHCLRHKIDTYICQNGSSLKIETSSMILTVIAEKGLYFVLPFTNLGMKQSL